MGRGLRGITKDPDRGRSFEGLQQPPVSVILVLRAINIYGFS